MRILVTGANGFLGYHTCKSLVESGHGVRGLVRRSVVTLPRGVETVLCADLSERSALRGALAGVEAVVHLAGRAHLVDGSGGHALEEFRRTNVQGTRVLFEESIAAGVRCFVLVSSVKAVGESTDVPWTEDVVPAPTSPYGVSKFEAEQVVRQLSAHHRAAASILRLPLAYGPGVKANMRHLLAWVARGLPLPLRRIQNRRSFVFVGNVAGAIRAVLAARIAGSETFFVSDQEDLSTPELVRRVAAAFGRRPRMFGIPPAALRLVGRIGDAVSSLFPVGLGSETIKSLTESLVVDSSKLTRMAGFVPAHTADQGLHETAAWFLALQNDRR
jgi:nucleoside-diphosphate-sugar epimerase